MNLIYKGMHRGEERIFCALGSEAEGDGAGAAGLPQRAVPVSKGQLASLGEQGRGGKQHLPFGSQAGRG